WTSRKRRSRLKIWSRRDTSSLSRTILPAARTPGCWNRKTRSNPSTKRSLASWVSTAAPTKRPSMAPLIRVGSTKLKLTSNPAFLLPYPFTILETVLEASVDFLKRLQPFALLVMRLVLGAIMIAHGYHKVWGGFHHHMDFVGSLGLPKWLAYFSAGTEFFGGIAIVLGLFTRFFAAAFIVEMAVAIWKVHFKNGLIGNGG